MGWKLPSSRVPGDMRDLGLSRLAIPCVAGPVLTSVCSLSPSVGPAPVPGGLPTSADHPRSQEPTFSREASEEEQLVGWEGGSKPLRILIWPVHAFIPDGQHGAAAFGLSGDTCGLLPPSPGPGVARELSPSLAALLSPSLGPTLPCRK